MSSTASKVSSCAGSDSKTSVNVTDSFEGSSVIVSSETKASSTWAESSPGISSIESCTSLILEKSSKGFSAKESE